MSNLTPNELTVFSGSVDPVQDGTIWWQHSNSELLYINRNQLLNLSSAPLGLTDTQNVSNKTLDNTNSLTILDGSLTLQNTADPTKQAVLSLTALTTGTTRTYSLPDASTTIVGTGVTQTLTNKTLTAPSISGGTLDNATVTVDSVAGHTTANTGTIYGIAVTSGTIGSAALGSNSVTAAAIATNAVTASKLATNAITLGYVQTTTSFSVTGTGSSQAVTPLTLTVTVPSGGRMVKITAFSPGINTSAANTTNTLEIWDGTVGSGTRVSAATMVSITGGYTWAVTPIAVVSPSAGSKTYNVAMIGAAAATLTATASATSPAFLLVEAI